jgi:hypothetical protein
MIIEHFLTIIGFLAVMAIVGKLGAWFVLAIWEISRRCTEKHMFHCWHYDGTEEVPKDKGACREPGKTKYAKHHCCRCKRTNIQPVTPEDHWRGY